MTRNEALGKARNAVEAKRRCCGYGHFQWSPDDEMRLDEQLTAMEALGLLTFDAGRFTAYRFQADWSAPSVARNAETPQTRRVPRYPSRTPAEVLGDVHLGTGSLEQWLVGRGPNGADRLIEALEREGFQIVKRPPDFRITGK